MIFLALACALDHLLCGPRLAVLFDGEERTAMRQILQPAMKEIKRLYLFYNMLFNILL
jgi:hypothetical protein